MIREPRKEPTYPKIDMTKPLDTVALMKEVETEDCYTRLWKPEHPKCAMCSDNEVCGILFHRWQNKKVKALEKAEGGFLDNTDFEAVDTEQLVMWLSQKQRTAQELIDRVTELSRCPDEKTCEYWCRSFILTTKGLSTKDGKVIVRK